MNRLPSYIVDLKAKKQLQRKSLQGVSYGSEKELDNLVIDQRQLLGDLLVENRFLDDGLTLKFIGRQFLKIDVLFAAVDEDDVPNRLVLIEDKLVKNAESKRQVIGQIIDYAASLTDANAKKLRDFTEHKTWVDENAEALDLLLADGRFLLVICGDDIHANIADIIGRLARQADRHPTSGIQICLVAMQLYGDETTKPTACLSRKSLVG